MYIFTVAVVLIVSRLATWRMRYPRRASLGYYPSATASHQPIKSERRHTTQNEVSIQREKPSVAHLFHVRQQVLARWIDGLLYLGKIVKVIIKYCLKLHGKNMPICIPYNPLSTSAECWLIHAAICIDVRCESCRIAVQISTQAITFLCFGFLHVTF